MGKGSKRRPETGTQYADGWVKTMHESREKKEVLKLGECTHSIEEWCEVCQYDENGDKYEF